jgi:tetratricopeptide (TPR) repeat protein
LRNEDFVVRDFVAMLRLQNLSDKERTKWLCETLLTISPHSPMARTALVRCDWEGIQSRVKPWEKEAAPYPGLLAALAERYAAARRYADAERCLKSAVKILPGDVLCWRQLAGVYQLQGQSDRWLATLEEYLQKPDYALNHYSVQSDIADYFMKRKEWEKALRYAEGAAECYSAFGLLSAGKCYEGLQRWDQAEKAYRACSERYENQSLEWYFFCRRTGQGDLEAARSLAQSHVAKEAGGGCRANPFNSVTFYLLEKQPDKALTKIEQALGDKPAPCDVLWGALIADLAKDAKKRDAALERAKTMGAKPAAEKRDDKAKTGTMSAVANDGASVLAELLMKDLARGGKGQIDVDAADKSSASLDPWFRAWFHYLLGHYLDSHGQHERADSCWKQCMSWTPPGGHRTISGAMLLEHGIKPADYRTLLQPDAEKSKKP